MDALLWLQAHGEEVVAAAVAVHGAALLIVNLTPTPKDNEVLAKVYSFVEVLAGIVTRKAKT